MNEVKIEDFKGIQGYHKKMTIDGHIYLKPSGIIDDKVKAYFMKLRSTTFVDDLEKRFGYTDFLKGVLGNVMWFEVHDDFMGKEATDVERGTWIHFCIAFPLLCMSGTANLRYAALEIQQAMEEVVDAKKEARTLSVALAKAHGKIEMLKGEIQMNEPKQKFSIIGTSMSGIGLLTIKKKDSIEPVSDFPKEQIDKVRRETQQMIEYGEEKLRNAENQKTAFADLEVYFPNQKWYPLSFINKTLKDVGVTLSDDDASEFCFSDKFQLAAKQLGYVEQTDKFHFKLLNGNFAKTYKPTRQDKARFNRPGVQVQYFSLNRIGVSHCLEYLIEEGMFNEKIKYSFI